MVIPHSKLFSMTIFFAFVLLFGFGFSSSALATSSSITMSTDDANFTIAPTESGNFVESSTGAIISITTDNYTGYKLTLESTSSTSPALVNVADSSKSIPSITSTISQSDFTSNSSYVNKWGIKPSKLNGAANSNYLPAPTSTAITIEQTAAANPTTANTYTIYPAARINYEVEAGSYSATLIAKVVINPATYTITYTDSSSSASNMPSTQTGTTSDTTVTLSSNTPTRTNYTFQGWCTTAVTNQDTGSPSCSGTTYSASSNYNIGQTTNNTLSLNAIWKLNDLTASFTTDGTGYGSVSGSSITTTAGSTITVSGNTVTINGNTITATPATETAQYTYAFSSWTNNCGSTLSTNNCTIQANFTRTTRSYTVTIARNNTSYGSVSTTSLSKPYGSTITASGSTSTSISVGGTTITATANSGYQFTSWTHSCGTTLTGACTITANFATVTTFAQAYAAAGKSQTSGYYKMQDMTSSICDAVTTPTTTTEAPSIQLIDSRDNKLYWVSKLLDGECWMTQNLDLDITTSGFTNTDTDLNSVTSWTWTSTYPATATRSASYPSTTSTATISWDYGNYIYDGTTTTSCGDSVSGYSRCTSYGFSLATSLATDSVQWHYHVGNMYQWNAATAGSGGTITSSTATDSICSKGWRLPTSGEQQLLRTTYSVGRSIQILIDPPLYYVLGGDSYSGLRYAGYKGVYWSSEADSNKNYADSFSFMPDYITLVYGGRYIGENVRCIAR